MDIGSIGNVASAYQYVNQIKNKQVSSSGFASSLKTATSSDDKVDAYKNSLQTKFGCPITVANIGKEDSLGVDNAKVVSASDFKEVESANYRLVPESDIGALRIYVNGESAGLFFPENMKIQEDSITGLKVLIGEIPGVKDSWYDAIPVTDELENALADAIGADQISYKKMEGYYIGTHPGTGIRYLMKPGDEGRGGKVLLCSATDEARYMALGEEYAKRYPNLVTSQDAGLFYASLEIRGMAYRGANGIVKIHPENISYNDNDDEKKNWSAKIGEKTWNLMLSWFQNHRLNTEEMTSFKYWDDLLNKIGGNYERVWSDDEVRQGYLNQ